MFTGIRARLIWSYMAVILVALAIAFIALILVSRPLQTRFIELRLASELNRIVVSLNQALRQNVPAGRISPERLSAYLNKGLPSLNGQLLILRANGRIVFDSREKWVGQSVDLSSAIHVQRANYTSGQTIGPNDRTYIYAATPLVKLPTDSSPRLYAALVALSPRTTSTILGDLWVGFFVAGLIAFLLSVLLGLIILRSVTKPLRTIALATDAVARGDYSQRVPQEGPKEIKQVAAAFNSMTKQVQASQTAMRDFVSNVSHDLKTPLTSIQGFSQALLEGATQDEISRKRAAGIIFDEATRMRRLVEDLLDLARIDAGQIIIGKNPIDLSALLDIILNNLAPQAAVKELALIKNIENLPTVVGDGDRLTQTFTNLIDNALKHSPPGGQIMIKGEAALSAAFNDGEASSGAAKRYAKVVIADSGPGIGPEDMKRIFERFYQVDKSRKQGLGTGLGLAIAYNIVKAHSGHIEVQSASGKGSAFTVWLPTTEADISTIIARRR